MNLLNVLIKIGFNNCFMGFILGELLYVAKSLSSAILNHNSQPNNNNMILKLPSLQEIQWGIISQERPLAKQIQIFI